MLNATKSPALIIVDMQNDFVRAGAPMEVHSARGILPGLADLLSMFRAARLPVIFTRYLATPGYQHLSAHLAWIKLTEPPVRACVPGVARTYNDLRHSRDVTEVVDELSPAPGEIVIDKPFFSAFHETNLHRRLQELEIDTLIITGTLTEMCVEDTARHAVHHGYPTVMVSDLVASNDANMHNAALAAFACNYGQVASAHAVVQQLAHLDD